MRRRKKRLTIAEYKPGGRPAVIPHIVVEAMIRLDRRYGPSGSPICCGHRSGAGSRCTRGPHDHDELHIQHRSPADAYPDFWWFSDGITPYNA